jgi:glycosyltransferase involved in cell wall biosynthesis
MRVLAAIVLAPHWVVSGAANAATRLSEALAELCDIELVRMASVDTTAHVGVLQVRGTACSNPLSFAKTVLPSQLYTQFYRSYIPELIGGESFDLVHLHNLIPTLEMKRIAVACVRQGIPYVISTHGIVEVSSMGAAYGLGGPARLAWRFLVDAPFRWVVRHAHKILALSPADTEILDSLGVQHSDVVIVPNGVDMPVSSGETSREIESVCRKYGLPFPKPVGVPLSMFLGNHTMNKGISVLLEAFSAYEKPYHLIVAGGHRPYVDYAKYTASRRDEQQMYFPGVISDEEKNALLRYVDLFIFPTLADTFPLSVLEAMAHGVPILATRVGGIPYQVDQQCGELVEPGNPAALQDGFERMIADRKKLTAMGVAARARAATEFNWTASAQKALAAYQSIM